MEAGGGRDSHIWDSFIFATFPTESGVMYGVFFLIHFYLSPSLPSCVHSIRSVMQKYLEERDELTFDKIFNQKIGEFEHCINYTMKKPQSIGIERNTQTFLFN